MLRWNKDKLEKEEVQWMKLTEAQRDELIHKALDNNGEGKILCVDLLPEGSLLHIDRDGYGTKPLILMDKVEETQLQTELKLKLY